MSRKPVQLEEDIKDALDILKDALGFKTHSQTIDYLLDFYTNDEKSLFLTKLIKKINAK